MEHSGNRPNHRRLRHYRAEQQVRAVAALFSTQQIGNALGWGLVDTSNSFVWEIGHTSPFTTPAGQSCVPGQRICDSYDTPHWKGFTPLRILSVTFADGSQASKWAVVSDLGGTAEVTSSCGSYGGPYCTCPWYAANYAGPSITYGADYPGTTTFDYGRVSSSPLRRCAADRSARTRRSVTRS